MKKIIITFCLFLCTSITMASDNNFTWNGVVTQGLFHTDNNNLYGESEDGVSLDFTELSLNSSYDFPGNLRLAGQVIYRRAGSEFDDVSLDYLLLDYQFVNTEISSGGFRLGRVKVPYGFYNEARDIAFTRPSVFLSQGLYKDTTFRQSFVSADGIDLYIDIYDALGQWNIDLGYGVPRDENISGVTPILSGGIVANFSADDGILYRVQFTNISQTLSVAFSGVYFREFEIEATIDLNTLFPALTLPAPPVSATNTGKLWWNALSFQYLYKGLTFTLEYARIEALAQESNVSVDPALLLLIPPAILSAAYASDIEIADESYYLQLEQRLSSRWGVFARYDVSHSDKNDRNGSQYQMSGLGQAYERFAKTSGVGIRWTPKLNTMFNLEYHYVDGTSWLNGPDNPNLKSPARYWNILAVSFSYRF